MGMSGDFAKAIAFGATYVRVGTAIFGERMLLDLAHDDDLRAAPDLGQHRKEIAAGQGDAALGRCVTSPRQMHEDGAAFPPHARPVVVAEHEDEIVEMRRARFRPSALRDDGNVMSRL